MTERPMPWAPLRDIARGRITAEELLWTHRAGFCTVLPGARVERQSDLRIEAAGDARNLELLQRLFADPGYASHAVAFARLNDVVVDTALGVAARPDGTMIQETMTVATAIDPALKAIRAALRHGLADCPEVAEPVLHCFHRSTPAYGHFVFDCLAPIAWFRDAILAERIKLLFPSYFPGWGLQVLAQLGIDADRHIVCPARPIVRCRDIVIPTGIGTANTLAPSRALCAALRDVLAGLPSAPDGSPHVYLSRGNQTTYSNRVLDNEGAVQRALAGMGFAILEPGNMAFADQVAAFRAAGVIVGAHGSSFGNLIAAQRGAAVVDLMPDAWVGFWGDSPVERWVLCMTALFGQDYALILCRAHLFDEAGEDDAAARRRKGMHFEVDLELLKRVAGRAQAMQHRLPAAATKRNLEPGE